MKYQYLMCSFKDGILHSSYKEGQFAIELPYIEGKRLHSFCSYDKSKNEVHITPNGIEVWSKPTEFIGFFNDPFDVAILLDSFCLKDIEVSGELLRGFYLKKIVPHGTKLAAICRYDPKRVKFL